MTKLFAPSKLEEGIRCRCVVDFGYYVYSLYGSFKQVQDLHVFVALGKCLIPVSPAVSGQDFRRMPPRDSLVLSFADEL